MQTLTELNDNFAIPGLLAFEEIAGGLIIARVTGETCAATLFLQGAHLVHWQPAGAEPVLFLSERSAFAKGKAIRGGVPVIFPWFGARTGERTDGPSHGFARTSVWDFAFAAVFGEDVHVTLTLRPNEVSRALGSDGFQVAYEVVMGRTLSLRLNVVNQGDAPLHMEEALHTYFSVGDVESVRVHGLGGTEFLDKTDGFRRKQQEEDVLTLHSETDRAYLNTAATVTVEDPMLQRRIVVEKQGSETTVVWNPGAAQTAKLADMLPDGWRGMLCVETANATDNTITLRPSEAHTMEARVSVESLTAAMERVEVHAETQSELQSFLFSEEGGALEISGEPEEATEDAEDSEDPSAH